MDILDVIPEGERVTRKYLSGILGLCDRTARKLIERQRTSEEIDPRGVILSSSHKPGYLVSRDREEIKAFNREIRSRIRALTKILAHNERFLLFLDSMGG